MFKLPCIDVVPGSFNPVHDGHWWIFDNIPRDQKCFEISRSRVGKEDLSDEEIAIRLLPFKKKCADVVVTQAPLFSDKYTHFSAMADVVIFHIGIDTYERLIQMSGRTAIEEMQLATFIVYDRCAATLPADKPRNCYAAVLKAPEHLQNISSTLIRLGVIDTSGAQTGLCSEEAAAHHLKTSHHLKMARLQAKE